MFEFIKKWTARLVKLLIVLVITIYLVLLVSFQVSKSSLLQALTSETDIISTEKGDIEVYRRGDLSQPVVLVTHGSPGGYDQAMLMMTPLFEDDTTYLIPSRPGYLQTPLATGRTPAEQADAYAAMLDALDIDQVAVIGASGGGPSALEFARRHPERTKSLVLYAAVSQAIPDAAVPPTSSLERVTDTIFGKGFLQWAFVQPLKMAPEKMAIFENIYVDSWPRIIADEQKTELFTKLVESSLFHFPKDVRLGGYANDMTQYANLDLGSFADLAIPTLLVHGTADTDVPFATSEALSQEIVGAQTYWVEGGDHFMIISRSDEVVPVINDFLEQQ